MSTTIRTTIRLILLGSIEFSLGWFIADLIPNLWIAVPVLIVCGVVVVIIFTTIDSYLIERRNIKTRRLSNEE